MLRFAITILIVGTALIKAKECQNKLHTLEVKLQNDLLQNYPSPNEPPLKKNTDIIKVTVRLIPQYFVLITQEESFYLHTWLVMSWTDPFLQWNPADYGGINETTIQTYKVWDPMSIIDDYSLGRYYYFYSTNSVDYNGNVVYYTQFAETIQCKVDMRKWPYDTQVCNYTFGENMKKWKHVSFSLAKISSNPAFIDPSAGWRLNSIQQSDVNIQYDCVNDTRAVVNTIRFSLEIRREAAGLSAMIIIPSLVLMSLTMVSQLLEVNSSRLGMSCQSMFGKIDLLGRSWEQEKRSPTDVTSPTSTFLSTLRRA
ncbi:Neuronal acetylcholine receptor subunit alpha-10 [Eumeta japonica]|uniref:Neuronal acetylcholine receptor subunit alpha-10 n=1 Tax=Eumeta variegata TaxID=151549 RepID=A0A4C1UQ65_EUMVA|nr:Neuronal acetylcholine receptor subunit alpha-10 [Eumeta japonica]